MVVVSRKHSEHHAYELYAAVDGTGGAFVCDEHGVWRKAVGAYTCLVVICGTDSQCRGRQ